MMKGEKDMEISEEIPVELLQKGIKISEKEVLEHSYLTLEVNIKIIQIIRNWKEIC